MIGPERLENLLSLLIIECRDRPSALRTEHATGNLSALRAEAHSLKGAALSLGARQLSEAAIAIEALPALDDAEHTLVRLERAAAATSRSALALLKGPEKGVSAG